MAIGHAEIAGGGIAGLTAAAALAQRGWSVRVHERGAQLRATGAGIFIWDNGLRVLDAIGALDQAVAGAHLGTVRENRNGENKLVANARFAQMGMRVYTIVRQRLLDSLVNTARAAGVEIVTESEAVRATLDGRLRLASGRELMADLVITADGVNSACRDSLKFGMRRKLLADGAIRVLIPRLPEEVCPAGDTYYEYWSGVRRIIYAACSQTELYLALTTVETDTLGKAVPLRQDEWSKSFPFLRQLFARIGTEGRWDRFEVIRLSRWSAGRVAVLGDAAHAQPPNLGQGGGCALMSALGLAVALEQARSVEDGLRNWEARERPLIEHTQRISCLYSAITGWPPTVRDMVLGLANRSAWAVRQRQRAANHIPTGTTV